MDLPLFCFDWSCPFDTLYFIAPIYFDNWNEALSRWFCGIHDSRISLPSVKRWLQGGTALSRIFSMILYRSVIDSWSKYSSKICFYTFLIKTFVQKLFMLSTNMRLEKIFGIKKFYKDTHVSKFCRIKQFCKESWKIRAYLLLSVWSAISKRYCRKPHLSRRQNLSPIFPW